MQQLDANIIEIKKQFPEYSISLLAHEHGAKLAETYDDIDSVVVYPYCGSFSWGHRPKFEKGVVFDDLIVPVGNITGAGFFNVLLLSIFIPAKKRWMCNLVSKITPLSTTYVLSLGLMNFVYSVLAIIVTGAFAVITLPILFIILHLCKTKKAPAIYK